MGRKVNKIFSELISKTGYDFENYCIELLHLPLESFYNSHTLGHFEKEGIDAYSKKSNGSEYNQAFQFKGFEVNQISSSQKSQIKKSIKSFSQRKEDFDEFILVVNIHLHKEDLREELKNYFYSFETNSSVKYKSLDSNQFLKYLKVLYTEFLNKNFKKANEILVGSYKESMNQDFYYHEVPHNVEYKAKIHNNRNPSEFILSQIFDRSEGLKISNWYFVKSEFGFGKTSLSNNLAEQLINKDIIALYLPIIALSSEAFANYTVFAKESLKKALPWILDTYEENDPAFSLLTQFFKQILATPNKIILILDGLDEHQFCYKLNKLKILFSTLNHMTCNLVLTLRTEFFNERYLDIQQSIPKPENKIYNLELLEWTDTDIISYIDLLASVDDSVKQFRERINSGRYKVFYGDIPKRPLFLKMLISDINENETIDNISVLYERYFLKKFQIDQSGYLDQPLERPLEMRGGFIDHAKRLMSCTSEIASIMINLEDGTLTEFTTETEIEDILTRNGISSLIELTQNSVLVPFNIKSFKDYKLKFAHKSFQEYFIAKYLADKLLKEDLEEKYNIEYQASVIGFFQGYLNSTKELNAKNLDNLKIVKQIENAM